MKHHSGTPFEGRLLALPTKIILSSKGFPMTNTIECYEYLLFTAVFFITLGPVIYGTQGLNIVSFYYWVMI